VVNAPGGFFYFDRSIPSSTSLGFIATNRLRASRSAVSACRALQERDAAVERWLRDEVAPVFDAMKADPSRGLPAADVFDMVRARHAERLKSGA
jgi:hypothetical protein